MNNTRKVTLLYQKAHGQRIDASPEEKRELRKYSVSSGDGNYATKANISAYVKDVDNGYRLSFYDWCRNKHKADRRRKGSSENEMACANKEEGMNSALLGWLIWGIALYWMFHGELEVVTCAIAGAVISVVLRTLNRRMAPYTLFLLPIVLAVVFGR